MSSSNEPKLLPLWHGVTVQKSEQTASTFSPNIYPDFGGAGIDVTLIDGNFEGIELKSMVNIVGYGSNTCSLPFLPPQKLSSLKDPCIGQILKKQKKQQKFCLSLEMTRRNMKSKSDLRQNVLSSLEEIPKLISKNKQNSVAVPSRVLKLAKKLPKTFPAPEARWLYLGGTLAVDSSTASSPYLLHTLGKKPYGLDITPLKETADPFKTFRPHSKRHMKVPLTGGRIFEITNDPSFGVCCVRQSKTYHYINLSKMRRKKPKFPKVTYRLKESLSDVKISPYVPGEHLVVTSSGSLSLENANLKKQVWKLEAPLVHDPMVFDRWWRCDFGSHPRSVLYSDRMSLNSLDLRSKKSTVLHILSLSNPFLLNMEKLSVTKRLNDFQHFVATDFHLLICDERYPQQPVMTWNHMLESMPLYCDVKPYRNMRNSSEFVVLLGSQMSSDIASFHIQSSSSSIQPKSLSQPLHLSSPRDYVNVLKLCCHNVDDRLQTRLNAALTGVCAVPYSEKEGYSVLQTTSLGDIFYQDFGPASSEEKSFRIGPGCILPSTRDIPPGISSWYKKALRRTKSNAKKCKKSHDVQINKTEILDAVQMPVPSSGCWFCTSAEDFNEGGEVSDGDVCLRCGLAVGVSKKLFECKKKEGIWRGPSSWWEDPGKTADRVPKLIDLGQATDFMSQRILSVWTGDKPADTSESTSQSTYCSLLENAAAYQNQTFILDANKSQSTYCSLLENGMTSQNASISGSILYETETNGKAQSSGLHQLSNLSNSHVDPWSQYSFTFDNETDEIPPTQDPISTSALYMSKVNKAKKIKLSSQTSGF